MTPLERLAALATGAGLQPVAVAAGMWRHPDEHLWPVDFAGPNGKLDRQRAAAADAVAWVHAVMPDATSATILGRDITGPIPAAGPCKRSRVHRLLGWSRTQELPLVSPQTVHAHVHGEPVYVVNVPVSFLEVAA